MRKLLIGGIAATLLATAVAGVAVAHEKGDYRQRFAEALNLTEEQQAQMQQLWDQHREERQQRHEEMRQGPMSGMRALDPSSNTFQADVDKLIADAQARVAERMQNQAQMKLEMSKILTPEQQAKMQELMAQRGDRDGKGFGHHNRDDHKRGGERDCR
ncbi:Spy/CpxP family protein refolding chaperone [Marinobacterium sp. D7]|uniref:Spy/CpxP family protein refolding chaperone n=1 Tax=Marinobacterium ramblicola TaxID=2849041 RepID=UPI001C2D7BBC|nr:Spy/CpxP family protein refolding chaperone [Marinobacterium ramblicola]MBV1787788.1 Spy/CpxP family protein refolding chaperone [Marinobacterium ramblicola]